MSYRDKLDADQQITMEELIAALIYDYDYSEDLNDDDLIPHSDFDRGPYEYEATDMGKRILALVLMEFRPDLIADDEWSFNVES